MTPHNRSRERLSFPVRADHVWERIRIITRELDHIQGEIHGRLNKGDRPDDRGLVDDAASARILEQFRTALDQIRNMLWSCTEANKTGGRRDRQVSQAATLLRALAPAETSSPRSSRSSLRESGTQSPISFFDRLDRVIDNYVEGGGTLVEPSAKRRPKT